MVSFPIANWATVRNILSQEGLISVPVLITKIDIQNQSNIASNAETFAIAKHLTVDYFDTIYDGSKQFSLRDVELVCETCLWEYSRLKNNIYVIATNSRTMNHIHMKINEIVSNRNVLGLVDVVLALQQLSSILKDTFQWVNAIELFDEILSTLKKTNVTERKDNLQSLIKGIVPANHTMIHRVAVTPSRLVILPSSPIQSNRLIRMFPDKLFVFVSFCDEQGQNIYNKAIFEKRFKAFIEGGFSICNQHFQFVACSNSQMREKTCVFVRGSKEDVQVMRNLLVNENLRLKGIVKYLSRLGLFCTSDDERGLLTSENFETIDDKFAENEQLLTDGCGFISEDYMKDICTAAIHSNGEIPSMVQIRSMGCKGTLVVEPNLNGNRCKVQFRESMKKCESEHLSMCVVKEAVYNPVRLNREIINLLCSMNWEGKHGGQYSPHARLMNLQQCALDNLCRILLNQADAFESLKLYFEAEVLNSLQQAQINILEEPFWWSILSCIYSKESKSIRRKCHIPVPDGCHLMGCADPRGILKDGQIFVQTVRTKKQLNADGSIKDVKEIKIITGTVILYRNPCLDPGDVRIVEAVDCAELHYLKNVVVLPCSERSKVSLSAQCSGGDLDGDSFSIIWDNELVPSSSRQEEAVDYSSTEGVKLEMTEAEFIVAAMCNAALGKIANLHLALSDQLDAGARDGLARKLAKQQSIAVDFPKTGIAPDLPPEAKRLVQQKGYPDFMEKDNQYISQKTMGDMYHKVVSVCCDILCETRNVSFSDPLLTALSRSDSYNNDLIENAKKIYLQYEINVKQLMARYGLKLEAELVLGVPYEWSDEFALDHVGATASLKASWKTLVEFYRNLFIQQLRDDKDLRFASAWYIAAYEEQNMLRSFPWIITNFLCQLRRESVARIENVETHDDIDKMVSYKVGESIRQSFENKSRELTRALRSKLLTFEKISKAAQENSPKDIDFVVELYGSVALLLCDDASDLDVFVSTTQNTTLDSNSDQQMLLNILYENIDPICDRREKIYGAQVPILRLTMESINGENVSVDISAKRDGVMKARHIFSWYLFDVSYLVMMHSIKQWAQSCGLLGGLFTVKKDAVLNSGQLQALVVHFMRESNFQLKSTNFTQNNNLLTSTALVEEACKCDATLLGENMLSFYRFFAQMQSDQDLQVKWHIEEVDCHIYHDIPSNKLKIVCNQCERALNFLAVTRDWKQVLNQSIAFEKAKTILSLKLSLSLTNKIADTKDFHAKRLQVQSGVRDVVIDYEKDDSSKSRCLVIHASGSCSQIEKLRRLIVDLMFSGRAQSYGAIANQSSAYFMENSTFLFSRNIDYSKSAMFEVRQLHQEGFNVQPHHKLKEITSLVLRSSHITNWVDEFKISLINRFLEQLDKIESQYCDDLQFSVHFGTFYMVNATNAFSKYRGTMSCEDLECAMSSGRRNRQFDNMDRVYDDSSRPSDEKSITGEKTNISMKSSQQSSAGCGVSSINTQDSRENSKSLRVASSFVPCIPFDKKLKHEENVEVNHSRFLNLFTSIGFLPCDLPLNEIGNCVVPHSSLQFSARPYCKIEVNPSASFSVEVITSSDGKEVLSTKERFLSIVHGTLLSGEQSANDSPSFGHHDVRLKFGYNKPLFKTDDLYQNACPNDESPIIWNISTDSPNVSDMMKNKDKVHFVRQVSKRSYLLSKTSNNENPSNIDTNEPIMVASFSGGRHFNGTNLADQHSVCDISLLIDVKPIKSFVNGESSEEIITVWLKKAVDRILAASDGIREYWQPSSV